MYTIQNDVCAAMCLCVCACVLWTRDGVNITSSDGLSEEHSCHFTPQFCHYRVDDWLARITVTTHSQTNACTLRRLITPRTYHIMHIAVFKKIPILEIHKQL